LAGLDALEFTERVTEEDEAGVCNVEDNSNDDDDEEKEEDELLGGDFRFKALLLLLLDDATALEDCN
jgi:hypothetical protein